MIKIKNEKTEIVFRELDFKKTKGKVFTTSNFLNKCECGETVSMKFYKQINSENTPEKEMFIGLCKCGNVFIADFGLGQ